MTQKGQVLLSILQGYLLGTCDDWLTVSWGVYLVINWIGVNWKKKKKHKDLLTATRYEEASHILSQSPEACRQGRRKSKSTYTSDTLPHPQQTWLINSSQLVLKLTVANMRLHTNHETQEIASTTVSIRETQEDLFRKIESPCKEKLRFKSRSFSYQPVLSISAASRALLITPSLHIYPYVYAPR